MVGLDDTSCSQKSWPLRKAEGRWWRTRIYLLLIILLVYKLLHMDIVFYISIYIDF